MKSRKILVLALCVLMVLAFAGCAAAPVEVDDNGDVAATPFEKHFLAYPDDLDLAASGATSYDSYGDHFDSPYWKPLDVFNMTPSENLSVIPNFQTAQHHFLQQPL